MFFGLRIVLMSIRSLRANLLRSLLATLGVIIGVGAVISAIAVLEGAREDFKERMASLEGFLGRARGAPGTPSHQAPSFPHR